MKIQVMGVYREAEHSPGKVEADAAILDAVIGPLNVSAKYVEQISKGDNPPPITDTSSGNVIVFVHAIRDTNGNVGVLDELCAHRGASLLPRS